MPFIWVQAVFTRCHSVYLPKCTHKLSQKQSSERHTGEKITIPISKLIKKSVFMKKNMANRSEILTRVIEEVMKWWISVGTTLETTSVATTATQGTQLNQLCHGLLVRWLESRDQTVRSPRQAHARQLHRHHRNHWTHLRSVESEDNGYHSALAVCLPSYLSSSRFRNTPPIPATLRILTLCCQVTL